MVGLPAWGFLRRSTNAFEQIIARKKPRGKTQHRPRFKAAECTSSAMWYVVAAGHAQRLSDVYVSASLLARSWGRSCAPQPRQMDLHSPNKLPLRVGSLLSPQACALWGSLLLLFPSNAAVLSAQVLLKRR
jgi:hypothetical protein